MTSEAAFYCILLALLLTECMAFVGNFEAYFCGGFFSSVIAAGNFARRKDGSLAFFPPHFFGQHYSSYAESVSFSARGLLAASFTRYPAKFPSTGASYAPFGSFASASSKGSLLLLDGRPFALCASECQAEEYARLAEKLIGAGESGRDEIISKYLRARMDIAALRARMANLRPQVNFLRRLSAFQFFCVFVCVPIAYLIMPTASVFLMLFCGGAFVSLVCALVCVRAKYKSKTGRALGFALKSFFMFPFVCAHSQWVYAFSFREFHPAAMAAAVLDGRAAVKFLSLWLRDAKYAQLCAGLSDDARFCAESFNRALAEALLSGLNKDAALSTEEITALPEFSDATRCYCPRCLAEFELEREKCSDCGTPLEKL